MMRAHWPRWSATARALPMEWMFDIHHGNAARTAAALRSALAGWAQLM
jgi:hypothetical protein